MCRVTIFTVVEGQTENAVLMKLLAEHLGAQGIDFHAPIVTIGKGRGGTKYLRCKELCEQLKRFLRDKRQPYVTTFFDYYAFPIGKGKGWDFAASAKKEADFRGVHDTATAIENELHRLTTSDGSIVEAGTRFLPYVQLHELEALFFAEPEKMAEVFENPGLTKVFAKAVPVSGCCEEINDSPETAPSKRIEKAFKGYKKGRSNLAHGPRLAAKLDLATVRAACPRFDEWVGKLEKLGGQAG